MVGSLATEEALDHDELLSIGLRLVSLGDWTAGTSPTAVTSKLPRPLTLPAEPERAVRYVELRDLYTLHLPKTST